MRKPVACFVVLVAACCLAGAALAGPRDVVLPHRYIPGSLDGDLQIVVRPDGVKVGVWSYRSGAEYDIAVSRSDGPGRWTEPEFFGANDGIDQIEPAVATDSDGNLYLAYADRGDGSIRLSVLPQAGEAWSEAVPVLRREREASRPALRVVGDHLVLAFVVGSRVEIVEFPLGQGDGAVSPRTITESGDPVENRPGGDATNPFDQQVFGDIPNPVEVVTPIRKKAH